MQKPEWMSPQNQSIRRFPKRPVKPGLGGWLLLPAVKAVLSPLICAYYLLILSVMLFKLWPQPDASPEKLWQLGAAVAIGSAALIVYAFTAWAFFKKKRFVPKLMITLLLVELAIPLIRFAGAAYNAPPESAFMDILWESKLIIYILGVAVWVRYFQVSKRVAATFIH